jgi:hypothetical protein
LQSFRVYEIDAEYRPSDLSRHLHFILGQRSRIFLVASLIFLTARGFGVVPAPGKPCEITPLNDPDAEVHKDKMAMAHGAEVQKRGPGHCGISSEASMA